MIEPLISIILTCYNRDQYIVEALHSIKNQTYQKFECLVIDDGSTDSSRLKILATINNDPRFKLHFIDHIGFPLAKNYGLDHAVGEYIIFFDSDDIAHPDWLRLLNYTAQITKAPVVACNFQTFSNPNNIKLWQLTSKTPLRISEYSFLRMNLIYNARIMHFMWNKLIRADLYKGMRHEEQPALSDIKIIGDIVFKAKYIVELRLPLIYYRKHPQSMGAINQQNKEYWTWCINFQKEQVRIDWNRAPQGRYVYQQALLKAIQTAKQQLGNQFDQYCNLNDVQDILNASLPPIVE